MLCPRFFSRKITQSFHKFFEFFLIFSKSKKKLLFFTRTIPNFYIGQNLAKFSRMTSKLTILCNLLFSKFSATSVPKIWSFMSLQIRIFGVGKPSHGAEVPLQYSSLIDMGASIRVFSFTFPGPSTSDFLPRSMVAGYWPVFFCLVPSVRFFC